MGNNSSVLCESSAYVIQKDFGGLVNYTDEPVSNNYQFYTQESIKLKSGDTNKPRHKSLLFNQKNRQGSIINYQ